MFFVFHRHVSHLIIFAVVGLDDLLLRLLQRARGRYARVRNIGVIPNLTDLRQWMADAGYQNIELIDLSPTTTKEQRSTPWMRFESLDKSLDPKNASLTVEGLPAPLRAMLIGTR